MQIITGKTGTNHVAAEDDRALHAATIGSGNYVLNSGLKFEATIETSNNIVLAEGDLLINGTHARIRHGETETVVIENGTTGYNRIDLIVARYTKSSGIEDVRLAVIKGEPTTGTATQPEYTEGDVLDGVELAEMPLYAVRLSGVNVENITPLFTIVTGLDDVYRKDETYTQAEVNAIKTALQTSINTAQNAANTAQSTANTAVSNAATAQSTANTANNKHNYSTSETVCGTFNGKTLYRKYINVASYTYGSYSCKEVATLSFGTLVSVSGIVTDTSSDTIQPLPAVYDEGVVYFYANIDRNTKMLSIEHPVDQSDTASVLVILEYTK